VGLLLATFPALALSRVVAWKSRGSKLIYVRSAHRKTLDDVQARSTLCLRVPPKEGAHLLIQTRVRTLHGELGAILKRWHPDMNLEVEEMPVAA
jgi:hypothetical protein